jgi:DUF4097 and DUF4098 domain-containing protein YvlB
MMHRNIEGLLIRLFIRRGFMRYGATALMLGSFLSGLAVPRARADEWSKTYTLTGNPDLRVDTTDANIRVSTWDQKTIQVRVTSTRYKIGDDGLKVEEHQTGDTVQIEVRFPHRGLTINWNNSMKNPAEIEIQMPREGRIDLHTGDGEIELGSFKGVVQLRSGDGSQDVNGLDGTLHATTGDGHIHVNGRFDELELKTGDGNVEARASAGSALATSWKLESGDGAVTLKVPETLAADVDLHTGDGHIDLEMPITTSGKMRDSEVHGQLNGGGKLLTIHTGDGSIRLEKN